MHTEYCIRIYTPIIWMNLAIRITIPVDLIVYVLTDTRILIIFRVKELLYFAI